MLYKNKSKNAKSDETKKLLVQFKKGKTKVKYLNSLIQPKKLRLHFKAVDFKIE